MEFYFDFDPRKSASNKAKHRVDFVEAQALWADPHRRQLELPYVNEPREIVIGKMLGRIWSAIVTRRAGGLRIISVRRARRNEIEIYEAPR